MPTSALLYLQSRTPLYQQQHKGSNFGALRRWHLSVSKLQAVPARKLQGILVQRHINSCAGSAETQPRITTNQQLSGDVLTPEGSLESLQAAAEVRPILSGGGGGIFFFWQLGTGFPLLLLLFPAHAFPMLLPVAALLCPPERMHS